MIRLLSLTALLSLLLVVSIFTGCKNQMNNNDPIITNSTNIELTEMTEKTEAKNSDGYRQVDAEEAKRLMDEETDYIILDVRTEQEYSEGHIPGALLLPDYEVSERAEELLPDKEQMILVYCRSGNRSRGASAALAKLGYTNVIEFGGIRSWPYEIVT